MGGTGRNNGPFMSRPFSIVLLKFCLAFTAGLALGGGASAAPQSVGPLEMKAAVAARLSGFVLNWDDKKTILIGVHERSVAKPYLKAFRDVCAGKAGYEIVEIDENSEFEVDLLFIGGELTGRSKQVLERAAGRPILLVSDSNGFLEAGGMIQVTVGRNQTAEFHVNQAATLEANIDLAAGLLSNAAEVRK